MSNNTQTTALEHMVDPCFLWSLRNAIKHTECPKDVQTEGTLDFCEKFYSSFIRVGITYTHGKKEPTQFEDFILVTSNINIKNEVEFTDEQINEFYFLDDFLMYLSARAKDRGEDLIKQYMRTKENVTEAETRKKIENHLDISKENRKILFKKWAREHMAYLAKTAMDKTKSIKELINLPESRRDKIEDLTEIKMFLDGSIEFEGTPFRGENNLKSIRIWRFKLKIWNNEKQEFKEYCINEDGHALLGSSSYNGFIYEEFHFGKVNNEELEKGKNSSSSLTLNLLARFLWFMPYFYFSSLVMKGDSSQTSESSDELYKNKAVGLMLLEAYRIIRLASCSFWSKDKQLFSFFTDTRKEPFSIKSFKKPKTLSFSATVVLNSHLSKLFENKFTCYIVESTTFKDITPFINGLRQYILGEQIETPKSPEVTKPLVSGRTHIKKYGKSNTNFWIWTLLVIISFVLFVFAIVGILILKK